MAKKPAKKAAKICRIVVLLTNSQDGFLYRESYPTAKTRLLDGRDFFELTAGDGSKVVLAKSQVVALRRVEEVQA